MKIDIPTISGQGTPSVTQKQNSGNVLPLSIVERVPRVRFFQVTLFRRSEKGRCQVPGRVDVDKFLRAVSQEHISVALLRGRDHS